MMKIVIASEAIFFLSLIVAYLYFWRSGNFQTEATAHLHVVKSAILTGVLLCSSLTFWRAEKTFIRKHLTRSKIWLGTTVILGIVFLVGQGQEYYQLLKENLTISKSEFGSSFYTLTGFHGLHVIIGVIILMIMLTLAIKGYVRSSALAAVGIYWHFVDAVWLFVFTTVYLLPYWL